MNPTKPFQANTVYSDYFSLPFVLKESKCSTFSTPPSNNLDTYTTFSVPNTGELASFTSEMVLSNCIFKDSDKVIFSPRSGTSSGDPLSKLHLVKLGNPIKESYGFNCSNCGPNAQPERIEVRVSREIQAFDALNAACDFQASSSAFDPTNLTATQLSKCSTVKMVTTTAFVQTGPLRNTTTNNPNQLINIYSFTPSQLGFVKVQVKDSGGGQNTYYANLSSSQFSFTAPFVFGCNGLSTTYQYTHPKPFDDALVATYGRKFQQNKTIGQFASQTTLSKCTLANSDTVVVSDLTPHPDNAGDSTHLSFQQSSDPAIQPFASTYQLRFGDCQMVNPETCPNENLIFTITRNVKGSNSNDTGICNPIFTNTAGTVSISHLGMCDTFTIDQQTTVIQRNAFLNSEPYEFAKPLATFKLTAPMVSGTVTQTIGISDKTFRLVPSLDTSCKVVVKSSTRKK
jgi:hypothetical protein